MISMANLFKLKDHKSVELSVLEELFAMERSTLITLILLETILLYILVPILGNSIIAWYGITISLSLWRLYNAYDYKNHPERNSPKIWHEKFVVQVWLTALLFSILAIFSMPNLDSYYQLFIFIVLVGISSGAVKALSADHRTAIWYLIIMLFPLMVEMLLLMRKDTYILAFLVVIYFFTQMSMILNSYERSMQLKAKEREIAIAKAKLHEKQEIVQRFFEQASDALFSYDKNLKLLDCNDSFLNLLKMKKEEIIGKNLGNLPLDKLAGIAGKTLQRSRKIYRGTFRTAGAEELWIEAKFSTILNENGEVSGGIALIEDKTREQRTREELEYLVSHDPLTSVSNKRGFQQYMGELIKKERHKNHYSLLLYLDLKNLKKINDTYGHETGNWVLIETGMRLKRSIDTYCNVSRFGGDEFSIVIPFVATTKKELHDETNKRVAMIEELFSEPFGIEKFTFEIGYDMGIVPIKPGSKNIETILQQAGISLLEAKKSKKSDISIYNDSIGEKYKKIYMMQEDLQKALKEKRLELFFQPVFSKGGRKLRCAEALLRWNHPTKGQITPDDFLNIASGSGIMREIDDWVFEECCKTIARWKERDIFKIENISINMNLKKLLDKNSVIHFAEVMKKYRVAKNEIVFEIDESLLTENFDVLYSSLENLEKEGFLCAIDNFGSNYTILPSLRKLSFHLLKIDRYFIDNLNEGLENIFFTRMIIEMGKKFNYDIVAKGVENRKQETILKSIDPDIMFQGELKEAAMSEKNFIERYLA